MKLHSLLSECINTSYHPSNGGSNFAVRRYLDTLYIFFEGSDGKEDWKVNFDFPAKAYKRMGITAWFAHRGFLDAWKKTEPHLEKLIADPSVHKIILVGYSHGAAIALLCHEYIWYHRPDIRDNIESCGFGCPRVIWGLPNKAVRSRWKGFSVIRNIDDIVTHLPPALFGYTHVGKMITVGSKGKYSRTEAHYAENILAELKDVTQ